MAALVDNVHKPSAIAVRIGDLSAEGVQWRSGCPLGVTKEFELLRKQNKQYQSERDVAINKLRNPNRQGKSEDEEVHTPVQKRRRAVLLKPNGAWQKQKKQ